MRLECHVCGVEILTIEAGDVLVQVNLDAAAKILASGQFDLITRRPHLLRRKRGRPRKLPVPATAVAREAREARA